MSLSLITQRQPALLESFAGEVRDVVGSGAAFFDLGPGPEWSVTRNTLPALGILQPSHYLPVDIEPEFTQEAARVVAACHPRLRVEQVVCNFHQTVLPPSPSARSIVWYPGSTFGNLPFAPGETFLDNAKARGHLELLRQGAAADGGDRYLVVLMAGETEPMDAMMTPYDPDAIGGIFHSALFKLRRDLGADAFDPTAFVYKPTWNPHRSTVDHVFEATSSQSFRVHDPFTGDSAEVRIAAGEGYVIANSTKPRREAMQAMLASAGWTPLASAADREGLFHIHLARA